MDCYICERAPGPGGTRYGVREAIGVCHQCGIGICDHHARKADAPGSPILCPECARLADKPAGSVRNLAAVRSAPQEARPAAESEASRKHSFPSRLFSWTCSQSSSGRAGE